MNGRSVRAPHLRSGRDAESHAQRFLNARGLRTVRRNFRCRPGEIDLVMLHDNCLVIVEVRYRRESHYGGGLCSVSVAKQRRIINATRCFLQRHSQWADCPLRFDVVAVSGPLDQPCVDWCQRAFECID